MLELVRWTHPVKGQIAETVCPRHRGDLLLALKTLGIGCTGEIARFPVIVSGCGRCAAAAAGVEARFYLSQLKPEGF